MAYLSHLIFLWISIELASGDGSSGTDLFKLLSSRSRLDGSIARTIPNLSAIKCAIACAQSQILVAFNYNTVDRCCELIAVDHDTKLIADDNYSYYNKLDPCQSNPCLYGSKCVVTANGMDYQCSECGYPMTEKNCNVISNNYPECVKSNDFVYCAVDVLKFTFINWTMAYERCAELGMGLAVFNDEASHLFINDQLKKLGSSLYRYWIGLSRKSPTSDWVWVDGTPLGDHRPWYSDPQPHQSCVQLSVDYSYFVPDDCASQPNEAYYVPMCQKKYFHN